MKRVFNQTGVAFTALMAQTKYQNAKSATNATNFSEMNQHRYILEPYKTPASRYDCPSCGKRKTFSRYLDTETGEHMHPSVGRCNREINCGHHYTPKQHFEDNRHLFDTVQPKPYRKLKSDKSDSIIKPVSIIPFEPFEKSLQQHSENNFVKFLCGLFGAEITNGLIEKYFIGTSKHWNGATVFWQIDISGKLRTGKIMLYNSVTGKRVKEKINWVHSVLKIENFNLEQCFFGENLLQGNTKPVAIVESEKTGIIASVYLPGFIWLAVGSLTNLSAAKCKVLQGRSATLFPDLNGFEKWSDTAKELSRLFPGSRFNVSDLLERKATESERQQGLDIADYLIRFDYKAFQQEREPEHQHEVLEQPKEIAQKQELEPLKQIIYLTDPETSKTTSWEEHITDLEQYFETAILFIAKPVGPVILNPYSTITNVSMFIHSHLATVKANKGNRTFIPYLERLQELKTILTVNTN